MNPIGSIQATPSVLGTVATRRPDEVTGPSFKDYFIESMRRLQDAQATVQTAASPPAEQHVDAKLVAEMGQAAQTLRLAEQVGNRVAATIDEIKQIRV